MVTSSSSASGGTTRSAVKKPNTTSTNTASTINTTTSSSDKTRRNSPTSVVTSSMPATAASISSSSPPHSTNTDTNKSAAAATTTTTTKPSPATAVATTTPIKSSSVTSRKFWRKVPSSDSAAAAAAASSPITTPTPTTNSATPPTQSDNHQENVDNDEGDDDSSSTSSGIHKNDYDDEDSDDDDIVGGVLAVGVLKRVPTPLSSSSSGNKKAPAAAADDNVVVRKLPVTKQEATQQAISKTVAENLAEQEHKAKASGRRPSATTTATTTTTKPGAVKRRSSSVREANKMSNNAAAAKKATSSSKSSASATAKAAPLAATATIQRTTSSDTAASSHDEMMSIKNRERRRASGSSTSEAAAAAGGGGGTMHARRQQRASSRAHAAGGWSASDDDDKSTDMDAKAKAKASRSKSLAAARATRRTSSSGGGTMLVRTKSGDSTSSGDGSKGSAVSMMAVRKRAPSTRRSVLSRQNSLDNDDDDNGPSLAPAMSGTVASAITSSAGNDNIMVDDDDDDDGPSLAVLPGAFSVQANGQHPDSNNGKTDLEDTGPSLAPQVSTVSIMSPTTTTSGGGGGDIENQGSDDEVRTVEDVDTGVVVAPGAFVMYGPDHDPNSDSDDSSVSAVGDNPLDGDDLEVGVGLSARGMNNNNNGDISEPFLDEPILLPVQAMVYDPTVFDATVLEHDDEQQADPKAVLRLRLAQLAVVLFSLIGIVFVVISVVRGFGNQNASNTPQPDVIPTVQGWSLMGGAPIFGPEPKYQDLFGSAVAMSGNGKLLAVAAPGTDYDTVTLMVGALHFFTEQNGDNGTEWRHIKSQIKPGPGTSNKTSSSLAMSRNGNQVVIGYPRYQGGQVQLFHQQGSGNDGEAAIALFTSDPEWSTAGELVSPSSDNEKDNSEDPWFGYSVEVTPDGQYLAVGSPLTEPDTTGSPRGAVYFYQYNNNSTPGNNSSSSSSSSNETMPSSWTRLGDRLVGESGEQYLGWSLALCSPIASSTPAEPVIILRVAIGGPASNAYAGIVRVHELDMSSSNTTTWRQIGQTLVGSSAWLRFGESVAMSDDGTILAVGASGTNLEAGQVKVFRLNSNGEKWIPDAQTFQGNQEGEGFGAAVSLSADGSILAIGAPDSNEFSGVESDAVGRIKVYKYNSATKAWVQQGSSLGGSDAAAFGSALALSSDGTRVAGGAHETNFDGTEDDAGSVLVFNVGTTEEEEEEEEVEEKVAP